MRRFDGQFGKGKLIEHFHCYVEAIEGDQVRVRTRSSGGEEATAHIPLSKIRETERPRLTFGTPMEVKILDRGKQGRGYLISVGK